MERPGSILDRYDVIVIGGGHAGTEAAWAAASVLNAAGGSRQVALVTLDPSKIGTMSCNPAIGGLAKGQMVREIDALGGIMGRAIDATGIMFKMLNTSKGAAVRSPRAQADKYAYAAEVQRLLATKPGIDVIAGSADDILVENGQVVGIVVPAGSGIVHPTGHPVHLDGEHAQPIYPSQPADADRFEQDMVLRADSVVLTTGTFMRGLMHTGEQRTAGGRVGEKPANSVSTTLQRLGFELGRLKTGTPPRLARESIDWDHLERQIGDQDPVPFSDLTSTPACEHAFPCLDQVECRLTQTTAEAHDLIRANLHRAPMYTGQIDAECGPRYCPSIEDKVVRFEDRQSHHVFLEPESRHTNEVYCNGISTSLPVDVQEQIVRTMPGCERAEILRWGYAVEYDMVWPSQLDSTCETKRVAGLYLAGQINCTTGYEEAGGQGLIAGLNAARRVIGESPIRLGREQAYIGVMLDDLVTKTPREPYRMFTSRAEFRLLLRADNADERLTPLGRELGLIGDRHWSVWQQRSEMLEAIRRAFEQRVSGGKRLREIARRPHTTVEGVAPYLEMEVDRRLVDRVVTEAKYDGYIERQMAEVRRQSKTDQQSIPDWLDPHVVPGLRREAAEVLAEFRPKTMGQASRLAGINPADLTLLAVAIRRGPASAREALAG